MRFPSLPPQGSASANFATFAEWIKNVQNISSLGI